MVQAFGEKVLDIIETEPDPLGEVDDIGPVRGPTHHYGLGGGRLSSNAVYFTISRRR
jgi:hypothetical protein